MPHSRFDRLSPEKREQILRAAGREFSEHGYDGATIQAILNRVGISETATGDVKRAIAAFRRFLEPVDEAP